MKSKLMCGLRKFDGFDGFSCFKDDEFLNLSCCLSVDKDFLSSPEYGCVEYVLYKILREALALYFGYGPDYHDGELFDNKFHDFVMSHFEFNEFDCEYVPYHEVIFDQLFDRYIFSKEC